MLPAAVANPLRKPQPPRARAATPKTAPTLPGRAELLRLY